MLLTTRQPYLDRQRALLLFALALCETIDTTALLAGPLPAAGAERDDLVDLILHVERVKRRYLRVRPELRARLTTPRDASRLATARALLESPT